MSTKQSLTLIESINRQPDSKVAIPMPRKPRTSLSFTAQIADLEVGECCSRIGQLKPDMTLGEFAEQASVLKGNFRNNIAPSVRGAKAQTEGDYTIEVTTAVTTPGQMYLIAIVTRIA